MYAIRSYYAILHMAMSQGWPIFYTKNSLAFNFFPIFSLGLACVICFIVPYNFV